MKTVIVVAPALWSFALGFAGLICRNSDHVLSALPEPLPACRKGQIVPAPRSWAHGQWTHHPYCVRSQATRKQVCVFTDANYNNRRGVSIIARPDIAERLLAEGVLQSQRSSDAEADVKYQAIYRPGMGIGLFVRPSMEYKAGETILVDYPVLVVPNDVADPLPEETDFELQWRAVLQLPNRTRMEARSLAMTGSQGDEMENVMRTNSFTQKKVDMRHDLLFTSAARLNHHCLPNAVTRTSSTTFAMEVIALRDIQAGEELAISYLDASIEFASHKRQEELLSIWNFPCRCPLCSASAKSVAASDARRRHITAAKNELYQTMDNMDAILEQTKTLLELYDEEGMIKPKAEYYQIAALAAQRLGRNDEALGYAGQAKELWNILFGDKGEEVRTMEELEHELKNEQSAGRDL